jgi:putative nucleotidyltransferase-like protein
LSTALQLSNQLPPDADVAHDERLWSRLDALLDRAPRDSDLRFHGLEQLALRRRRLQGAALGPTALAAERTAAVTSLLAPLVLQRVLEAVDGPVVLMKGPEVAQWWQNPLMRPYRDVDVLVKDSDAAWHSMREAGFQPTGNPELYIGIHHLRPLVWPGLPLVVEVHHEPKWIEHAPPPTAELLETAVPSATGIPGLFALEPARHAVALAVHAWAHIPLARLDRLVDVAAVSQGSDRRELVRVARAWDVERIWRTTQATIDSLFGDRRRPPAGRVWARHLWQVRERTILERQLERWLGPFSGLPPSRAIKATWVSLADQFARADGETRAQMVRRVGRSVGNASKRVSDHEENTSR